MSSQERGVVVKLPGSAGRTVNHPTGKFVHIDQGHLLVLESATGEAIAIYAPANWISAYVVREEQS